MNERIQQISVSDPNLKIETFEDVIRNHNEQINGDKK